VAAAWRAAGARGCPFSSCRIQLFSHRNHLPRIQGLGFQAKKSPIQPQDVLSIHFLSHSRPVKAQAAPSCWRRGGRRRARNMPLWERSEASRPAPAAGRPTRHLHRKLWTEILLRDGRSQWRRAGHTLVVSIHHNDR